MVRSICCWLVCGLLASSSALGAQRVILQGNGKLTIVNADGSTEWDMNWGGIHDIHRLQNGHILVQQGAAKIAEIDPATKKVVWSYDSATQNGNAGKNVEVHAFQLLGDGRLMIAESGPARIIEVDRDGKLLKEMKLKVNRPHPHTDTRLARKLSNGNYLVCHEGDGFVREYDGKSSEVLWEYEVPLFGKEPKGGHGPEAFGNKCFAAVRLPNGHTLITTGNGHGIIEVTTDKKIVWKVEQNDLPGITLAWVTTLEVLPSSNYLIGNCHAGPHQPLLIELNPQTKEVVWKLERHSTFGNDVSNSQALDVDGNALR